MVFHSLNYFSFINFQVKLMKWLHFTFRIYTYSDVHRLLEGINNIYCSKEARPSIMELCNLVTVVLLYEQFSTFKPYEISYIQLSLRLKTGSTIFSVLIFPSHSHLFSSADRFKLRCHSMFFQFTAIHFIPECAAR